MPGDVTGSLVLRRRGQRSSRSGRVPSSRTCCWPTRSTGPRPRRRRRCSRRWRSGRSAWTAPPRPLPSPFCVAATQNPVEHEGTYPLPEAQLDRFLLKLTMPVPPRDDEVEVLARHARGFDPRDLRAAGVRAVASARTWPPRRRPSRRVRVAPEVLGYVVDVCRATRAVAVRGARGVPARRHRAPRDEPRVGVAVGARLRHPGRREGPRAPDPAAPAPAAPRGRARGRRRRRGARVSVLRSVAVPR